jgi:predicted nucleotidyltransferase
MNNLDFILNVLQKSDLVKVFVYGSRLYGVHNKDSDYDVCIIFKGFYGKLRKDIGQRDSQNRVFTFNWLTKNN